MAGTPSGTACLARPLGAVGALQPAHLFAQGRRDRDRRVVGGPDDGGSKGIWGNDGHRPLERSGETRWGLDCSCFVLCLSKRESTKSLRSSIQFFRAVAAGPYPISGSLLSRDELPKTDSSAGKVPGLHRHVACEATNADRIMLAKEGLMSHRLPFLALLAAAFALVAGPAWARCSQNVAGLERLGHRASPRSRACRSPPAIRRAAPSSPSSAIRATRSTRRRACAPSPTTTASTASAASPTS